MSTLTTKYEIVIELGGRSVFPANEASVAAVALNLSCFENSGWGDFPWIRSPNSGQSVNGFGTFFDVEATRELLRNKNYRFSRECPQETKWFINRTDFIKLLKSSIGKIEKEEKFEVRENLPNLQELLRNIESSDDQEICLSMRLAVDKIIESCNQSTDPHDTSTLLSFVGPDTVESRKGWDIEKPGPVALLRALQVISSDISRVLIDEYGHLIEPNSLSKALEQIDKSFGELPNLSVVLVQEFAIHVAAPNHRNVSRRAWAKLIPDIRDAFSGEGPYVPSGVLWLTTKSNPTYGTADLTRQKIEKDTGFKYKRVEIPVIGNIVANRDEAMEYVFILILKETNPLEKG